MLNRDTCKAALHDLIINHGVTINDHSDSDIHNHIATDLMRELPDLTAEEAEAFVNEPDISVFIRFEALQAWRFNEARKLTGRACELHEYVCDEISLHFIKELVDNLIDAYCEDKFAAPSFARDDYVYRALAQTVVDLRLILDDISAIEATVQRVNKNAKNVMDSISPGFEF